MKNLETQIKDIITETITTALVDIATKISLLSKNEDTEPVLSSSEIKATVKMAPEKAISKIAPKKVIEKVIPKIAPEKASISDLIQQTKALVEKGMGHKVKKLFNEYGIGKCQDCPPEKMEALITVLRSISKEGEYNVENCS